MRLVDIKAKGFSMKGRHMMRWLTLAMVLGGSALVPTRASAQVGERQCVSAFLAACATLNYISFSNTGPGNPPRGVLQVIVSNTSNGAVEANAYIKKLIFDFTGTLPAVQAVANAQYGTWSNGAFTGTPGDIENWKSKATSKAPKEAPEGFSVDFELDDNAKEEDGGVKGRVLQVGEAVMITVNFDSPLAPDVALACGGAPDCQDWSAEMKGMDVDGKGKGFTTTPEPATIFLLGSGLLGLVGVGAVRKRWGSSGD